jgi:hypothetical protein
MALELLKSENRPKLNFDKLEKTLKILRNLHREREI